MYKLFYFFCWCSFLLSMAELISGDDCNDQQSCEPCVNKRSWNHWAHCRWCPLDRECHTFGAVATNPCPSSLNIKYNYSCPSPPNEYSNSDKNIAYAQLLTSAAAYSDEPFQCMSNIRATESNLAVDIKTVSMISQKCNDFLFDYGECSVIIAVSESQKSIYISFRGTTSLKEFVNKKLSTLFEPTMDLGKGHVQDYFLKPFYKLKPCLTPEISKLTQQYSDYMVRFSGHSLGGALASIAAFDYVRGGTLSKNKVSLYTYGMPRVGDKAFAAEHETTLNNSYRIVNYKDCVPHYPKSLLSDENDKETVPYHHPEEVFYYTTDMQYDSVGRNCDEFEDPQCSSMFRGTYNDCPPYHNSYFGISVGTHCDALDDRRRNRAGPSDIAQLLSSDQCSLLTEEDVKITTTTTTAATSAAETTAKSDSDKVSSAISSVYNSQLLTCTALLVTLLHKL